MLSARRFGMVAVLAVFLAFVASAVIAPAAAFLGNPHVLPPHSRSHGLTYAE